MSVGGISAWPPAGLVVYRHPCSCDPGEEPEHRFDVDGEPFPWYITEDSVEFTRRAGLYLVDVGIMPLRTGGHAGDELAITVRDRRPPLLNGEPFPWAILAGSIRVDAPDNFPILYLTFLANEVDTDIIIDDDLDS